MRRIATILTVVGLLMAYLVPSASATPGEGVYLSMGTSLAAGSQIDEAGDTTSSSNRSYTDELHRRLTGRLANDLSHVKLGCAGETAEQLLGGVDFDGNPSICAQQYDSGSQIGDALATIATTDVLLVTIDVGANDLFEAQEICGIDSTCLQARISATASLTAQIVATLRGVGYEGPIVGMSYYNPLAAAAIGHFSGVPGQHSPDLSLAHLSDVLVRGLNGALAQAYGAFGVPVADVYRAFNAGDFGDDQPANGVPDNSDVLCALSYMCPMDATVKANIHLNKKGYTVVAKEFLELIDW